MPFSSSVSKSGSRASNTSAGSSSSGIMPPSNAVADMMKNAVTTSDDFFQRRNAVEGTKDRKDSIRQKRAEAKSTLSQWYNMKRTPLSNENKQEIELLQYRNFVYPETKHMAPKKTSDGSIPEFVEFGYFADVGRSKRRRIKSFADEWAEENPEVLQTIEKRMKTNLKIQKKSKVEAAKKIARQAERERNKRVTKRKKGDAF